MSSSASSVPRRVGNSTRRWRTSSSGTAATISAAAGSARRAASRRAGSRSARSAPASAPGKIVIHHSPENRKSLPTRISVPSEGEVGGTPTPRNDSVASVRIAVATWIVASTSTGPSTLGSTWRRMMRSGDTPMTRAACTYSLLRSTSVEPRTVRAYCTQPVSAIANISTREGQRVVGVGKQRAADAVDQQRDQDRRERQHHVAHAHDEGIDPAAGKARQQAQADADHAPTAAPRRTPTSSEMRAPYISADRMSRPWSSVPSRYLRAAALASRPAAGARR